MLNEITTEQEYMVALERFEEIFQADAGTTESDEADVLAIFIKAYEERIIQSAMQV